MLESVRKQIASRIMVGLYLAFVIWWLGLQFVFAKDSLAYNLFGSLYGVMALAGAVYGIKQSLKWGGLNSLVGRALMFYAFGLLAQEFGQLVYFYYIFYLKVPVPYPSYGDIGYFGSIFFYIYATLELARAAGVEFGLREVKNAIVAIILPIAMLAFSYFFFLSGYMYDFSTPLKVVLDIGYPLGQAFYISLAILTYILSRSMLGGMMKSKVLFLLFALLMQYIADYTFLYQSSRGTWVAGGVNDLMYLTAYFLMAYGLTQFNLIWAKLRE